MLWIKPNLPHCLVPRQSPTSLSQKEPRPQPPAGRALELACFVDLKVNLAVALEFLFGSTQSVEMPRPGRIEKTIDLTQ